MKRTLVIALALTLVLAVVSVTVWAGPSRQGTVPVTPKEADLLAGVKTTLGTMEVTLSVDGTFTLVEDPETEFGAAPTGLDFLSDTGTFALAKEGDITVCYPYPQAVKDLSGDIYKWDEDAKEWVVTESTISGDPPMICFTDKGVMGGTYSLLGG
ncbi:MAG: hypothetical protein Q7J07_01155 [Pelolinea sp.]|nr:hypothetical protein [Pelolinea sp.]